MVDPPAAPPRPRNRGRLVTRFDAFLSNSPFGFSSDGKHMRVTFQVPAAEDWQAMLLKPAAGLKVHVEVYVQETAREDALEQLKELAKERGLNVSEDDDADA